MKRREWFKISVAGAAQIVVLVIPTDEHSPGAHDAGVSRFPDLLAAHSGPKRQQQWRRGIEAMKAAAHEGEPRSEVERFLGILKPAEAGVMRYMRWTGNHPETAAWTGRVPPSRTRS